MTRFKAFLVHFLISLAIFLVLLYLIVFVWYPQPYFAADGGWQGIRLIFGVDLVLGPLLTLIVFRPGKPGLKLDLALIGLLQASALAWGVWIVHDQRTALVVYADGTFTSLTREQIRDVGDQAQSIVDAAEKLPALAFVQLPADKKERLELKFKTVFSGLPLYALGERYQPFDAQILPEVISEGESLEAGQEEAEKQEIERFLTEHGGSADDYRTYPLRCRYDERRLVLRKADGAIVGSLKVY